jgi:hypothetical protein
MAEYILTGSRAWPTVYASQNGDGTGTFWANSFLPFFDRLTNLAHYLVEGGAVPASGVSLNSQTGAGGASLVGVPAYAGAGFTWSAGTLGVTLEAMAAYFDSFIPAAGGTVTGNLFIEGRLSATGRFSSQEPVVLTATTQTVGPADGSVFRIPAAGANIEITVNTTGILANEEIEFRYEGGANTATIQRSGGVDLAVLGGTSGFAAVRLVEFGGAWSVKYVTGDAVAGAGAY